MRSSERFLGTSPPCSSPSLLPDILIIIIINYKRERGRERKGVTAVSHWLFSGDCFTQESFMIHLVPPSVTICQLIDVEFKVLNYRFFALFIIILQFRG